jgi:formylglycine-generating enzyme required for sulfatase activity
MARNVFEWCLEHDRPGNARPSGDAHRVVRGGSWGNFQGYARAACRNLNGHGYRGTIVGLRVVCSSPIG